MSNTYLDAIFRTLDTDGNGWLTFDEVKGFALRHLTQLMGQNPTELEIMGYCDKIDKNGDGAISKAELKQFMVEFMEVMGDPVTRIRSATKTMMKVIDKDGNGLIDKNEFREFMEKNNCKLADDEIDSVFSNVDRDGDTDTLNVEEFVQIISIGQAAIGKTFDCGQ
ncbi:calmodulin-like protein 3 [Mya arenaria]|uniref:calmodulin-like protein 3 n=1 Tax=Mya arenaria TaxID=6604 RepID=UPI0022E3D668|nr:calmodulin-like protein 3 [Mya arenaria]